MQTNKLLIINIEHVIKNKNKSASCRFTFNVLRKCDFSCQQCGNREELTVDHKFGKAYLRHLGLNPLDLNEMFTDTSNYWILCRSCHDWKTEIFDPYNF